MIASRRDAQRVFSCHAQQAAALQRCRRLLTNPVLVTPDRGPILCTLAAGHIGAHHDEITLYGWTA